MEDDKNNDNQNILFNTEDNGGKEEKMKMNVLFMRINLYSIYGAQGSINM